MTHVVSHLDVIRLLAAHKDKLVRRGPAEWRDAAAANRGVVERGPPTGSGICLPACQCGVPPPQLPALLGSLCVQGGMAEASLEALGLDEGAVFCVPASTPALEAFGRMAIDQKSSLGLTDAAGKLVRRGRAQVVRTAALKCVSAREST